MREPSSNDAALAEYEREPVYGINPVRDDEDSECERSREEEDDDDEA